MTSNVANYSSVRIFFSSSLQEHRHEKFASSYTFGLYID